MNIKQRPIMRPPLRQLAWPPSSPASCGAVKSAPVNPAAYSFDQRTDCGVTWCYRPAYTKLTDGVLGKASWAVNNGQELGRLGLRPDGQQWISTSAPVA